MPYYLQQRRLWRRGPYSLEELQRYLAQGKIGLADLARSDSTNEWVPVGQLMGNVWGPPGSIDQPAVTANPAGSTVRPEDVQQSAPASAKELAGPMPPQLHWLLLLVLGLMTGGLFTLVWEFVQARFVKKIRPASNCIAYVALSLVPFIGFVFFLIGAFKMRSEIEEYYNTVEPINLRLSSVMTIFFNTVYFQYHFCRIARQKKAGLM